MGLEHAIQFSLPTKKRVTVHLAPGDEYQTISVDGVRHDGSSVLSELGENEGAQISFYLDKGEHTITRFIYVHIALIRIEDV